MFLRYHKSRITSYWAIGVFKKICYSNSVALKNKFAVTECISANAVAELKGKCIFLKFYNSMECISYALSTTRC